MKSVCFLLKLRFLREDIGLNLKPFLILKMLLAIKTGRCGFYKLAEDPRYGSSPDALCPGSILSEVKTRAENCSGPLDDLVGKGHYVLQPNLQMMCTRAKYCILESYHPESKLANCRKMTTFYAVLLKTSLTVF